MTPVSTTMSSSAEMISARLERLPMSRWHIKARVAVGAVTFFDGFDQLMIAYSLPVLIPKWNLTPASVAWVIAIGGIGMLVGALGGGWLADRMGRLNVIIVSLALYAVMSLGMAFTDSLMLFLVFRFVQGIGLGAEVPVAATYIGEITKAHKRGRFVLLYEVIFPIGLVASAIVSAWVVPRFGYQILFALGAIPILLLPALFRLPESPRWLAVRGRLDDADAAMRRIETEISGRHGELPEPRPIVSAVAVDTSRGRFIEAFQGVYLRRTLMLAAIWGSAYFVNYGIASWLPTLYRTVFEVSVDTALHYSIFTTVAGLVGCLAVAFLIDNLGRRICITSSMVLCAALLFLLAGTGTGSAVTVLLWSAGAALFVFAVNMALYVYTAELYPTRMRAIGCAIGGAAGRLGIIVGPLVLGGILDAGGTLTLVFGLFGLVALIGAIVVGLFATETREKTLEEISQ
ncbi:MFS transporter, putative metabolite:H+ symporter [Rhodococcus rhodochrous J3]|jgi:putative MFS transporter|uniref:MFS transporter, putative metabolite:H+ symporter n=1 Tax=Rhodococcus rhodochrous J3 TaxID=903528 RepID=A0ABY1M5S1_RHORH|nr:MFS transporter [Rhodococcus rhodochrous]MBF4479105.1 MFS transporter [Rhodococcus rhodochrous]SMG13860.1 MFS transporter, putative metabolite:H+ symporter [Rhodococcus rhodochrous J3]